MKTLFAVLLAICLCSCATKPTIYKALDTTKLDLSVKKTEASAARMHKAVFAAKTTHVQSQGLVDSLKLQAKAEGAQIEQLKPQLSELLRVAPPELRDQIDAARLQVEAISEGHAQLQTRIDTTVTTLKTEGGQIEEANAADKQHAIDMEERRAEEDKLKASNAELAQKATEESTEKAKFANKVRELESKNWIRRALEALAGLAILFVGFLYFTGKLALSGTKAAAAIASKV